MKNTAHTNCAFFAVKYEITCTEERMLIEVETPDHDSEVYLDNLKYYPGT